MNSKIIVIAMRDKVPENFLGVYIGRGRNGQTNPLGNPATMLNESERDSVCEKHIIHTKKEWKIINSPLRNEIIRLATLYANGQNLALQCFCAPRRCHGNYLVKLIKWVAEKIINSRLQSTIIQ
jgi:hypothetical protein